jgi:rhamnulokinase
LIAPACHDTAAAISGIPAQGDDWAYISSGTWSLVGTLLDKPCAGAEAAQLNFTNLGAVGGRICFLRNVNGLWLLNQCVDAWRAAGECQSAENLIDAAARFPAPEIFIDVDDPDLLAPGDMPRRLSSQLERKYGTKAPSPASPAAMTSLIFHSLAARYAQVLRQAEALTGKHFEHLYVVGGGSKNVMLNRLTQRATGKQLIVGAQESSTIGNFSVQLAALDQVHSNDANRQGVEHGPVSRWAAMLSGPIQSLHSAVGVRHARAAQGIEENT